MEADLGSLASDVAKRGIASLGEEVWQKHMETVKSFWDSIARYFEKLEVSNFKVYQDGMVADGEMGQKILEEGLKSGSRNFEIILKLIKRGAVLVKTEDFALVKKERDRLVKLTKAMTRIGKLIAYLKYRLIKNELLRKRDEFIANRINGTLNQGETGIIFIGAYHNIKKRLPEDIQIKEIKDVDKVGKYQMLLPFYKKNKEQFEELGRYLVSKVESNSR